MTERIINIKQLIQAVKKAVAQSVEDTAHTLDDEYDGEPITDAGRMPVIVCGSGDSEPHFIGRMEYLPAPTFQPLGEEKAKATFTIREASTMDDTHPHDANMMVCAIESMINITPNFDLSVRPVFSGDFNVNIRCVALRNNRVILAEFESQVPFNV